MKAGSGLAAPPQSAGGDAAASPGAGQHQDAEGWANVVTARWVVIAPATIAGSERPLPASD